MNYRIGGSTNSVRRLARGYQGSEKGPYRLLAVQDRRDVGEPHDRGSNRLREILEGGDETVEILVRAQEVGDEKNVLLGNPWYILREGRQIFIPVLITFIRINTHISSRIN